MLQIEKKKVVKTKSDYDLILRQRGLFGWKQISLDKYGDNYEVVFTRDPTIPNLNRIKELESAYPFGRPPTVSTSTEGLYVFLYFLGGLSAFGGIVFTIVNLLKIWAGGEPESGTYSLETTVKAIWIGFAMIAVAFIWQKLKQLWVRSEINDANKILAQQKKIESILLQEKLTNSPS